MKVTEDFRILYIGKSINFFLLIKYWDDHMLEEVDEAACKVLIRKFEGKSHLGELDKDGMRWDDDI